MVQFNEKINKDVLGPNFFLPGAEPDQTYPKLIIFRAFATLFKTISNMIDHRNSINGKVLFIVIEFVALLSWGDFCKLTCEKWGVSGPSSNNQSWKISTVSLTCEEWVSLHPTTRAEKYWSLPWDMALIKEFTVFFRITFAGTLITMIYLVQWVFSPTTRAGKFYLGVRTGYLTSICLSLKK